MGLYERLTHEQSPAIPQHALHAVLGEIERGMMTLGQGAAALGLDAGEQAELSTLLGKIVHRPESISLGGFATLTNVGTAYDTTDAARGLGLVPIQTAGITSLVFGVSVNKVGSGTQSWQLWNQTDAAEIGVIDDAGAAGQKNLVTTITPGSPLPIGQKILRVRVKSTVAQDDPIYYGAGILIRRNTVLTSEEVHEVTLCPTYMATSAALKARLGV